MELSTTLRISAQRREGSRVRQHRATYVCVSERITQVRTDIYVTSFGPVSDTEMVGTKVWSTQTVPTMN